MTREPDAIYIIMHTASGSSCTQFFAEWLLLTLNQKQYSCFEQVGQDNVGSWRQKKDQYPIFHRVVLLLQKAVMKGHTVRHLEICKEKRKR